MLGDVVGDEGGQERGWEILRDYGRSWEMTGDDGRLWETTGDKAGEMNGDDWK